MPKTTELKTVPVKISSSAPVIPGSSTLISMSIPGINEILEAYRKNQITTGDMALIMPSSVVYVPAGEIAGTKTKLQENGKTVYEYPISLSKINISEEFTVIVSDGYKSEFVPSNQIARDFVASLAFATTEYFWTPPNITVVDLPSDNLEATGEQPSPTQGTNPEIIPAFS